MRQLFTLPFFILLASLTTAVAQQRFTTNEQLTQSQLLSPRALNYWPEGGDIVTINGKNRFTRALYGNNTAFRLETSDGLEFGLFMPNMGGNVTMTFQRADKSFDPLEVESRYRPGQRVYRVTLPDSFAADRSQPAVVTVTAVALYDGDGGIWRIESSNVLPSTFLNIRYGAADNSRFSRNGDLGVDKKDCFDFNPERCFENEYSLFAHSFTLHYGQHSRKGDSWMQGVWSDALQAEVRYCQAEGKDPQAYPYLNLQMDLSTAQPQYFEIASGDGLMAAALPVQYEAALASALKVASSLQIDTPDPVFNVLGWTLAMAADAIWDDQEGVWMHGAIGWRNPLPGWRAAYVGDVLGWHQRSRTHFVNYARSQLVGVPVDSTIPYQDAKQNLARATEKIGAPMFSSGYIGRYPNNATKINHYDMNLVYIDELLWHFQWLDDWNAIRVLWPTLRRHLLWEKRTFDPDDDGLYDAYCCIWASDALYYNGGAVTHSSAYNYRANRLAADIAQRLGYLYDAKHFAAEADKTLRALNSRLWMEDEGIWAEYQDALGLQRLHRSPALWTFYHSLDSDIADSLQARRAAQWVNAHIPHYPVLVQQESVNGIKLSDTPAACQALVSDIAQGAYSTVATSNWQPYAWSINNVAVAEVAHTALALFQAGDGANGFRLLKSQLIDGMFLGASPGNIGQISFYDAARSECYRDFADPVGILSRTVVQGLFGIRPDRLHGRIKVYPQVPASWPHARIETADFSLSMQREGETQTWTLQTKGLFQADTIVLCGQTMLRSADGKYVAQMTKDPMEKDRMEAEQRRKKGERPNGGGAKAQRRAHTHHSPFSIGTFVKGRRVDLSSYYNLRLGDLFAQRYLSPRYPHATLSLPVQGIGEWCSPKDTFEIHDEGLRRLQRIPEGNNVVFTSLWDNFPSSVEIPLSGRARKLHLLMAGTTNWMQCRIANAVIRVNYADGSQDSLLLENPTNWWPIDQDLFQGLPAYYLSDPAHDIVPPLRMSLRTGKVYRPAATSINQKTDGGAANLIEIPLDPRKKLHSFVLETLANDVVIGILEADLK